jgi:hypothetical protein
MTFRFVDLITRLDGTRPRAYRMCDASGEAPPCPPPSEAIPLDTTPPHDNITIDGAGPSEGQNDTGPYDKGCGGGKHALPMLREQLRQSLQEPPVSPW